MRKRFAIAMLAVQVLVFVFPLSLFAQSNTGTLNGTVTGPDGAIAGAKVVVKDDQTGRERTVQTSDEGTFTIPQLEVGTYTVIISAPGFKGYTAAALKIDVGKEFNLAASLEVGRVEESVTITAGADIVHSSSGELSNTVGRRQIQELPLNGRNPLALIGLQAGTSQNGATNTTINGQRSSFTNITRDGINVQDNFIRANAVDFLPDRPNVDDVEEFTIVTQNAGADLGNGASQVQLVTPRGSNNFHGGVFEYNRNSEFTANTFFRNASGLPKSFLNRNQYGGKMGGPIAKDRLFFFGSFEAFRLRQSTAPTRTILLPQARNGIFTYRDNSNVLRTVNVLSLAGVSIDPTIQNRFLANIPTTGNSTAAGDQLNTTGFVVNRLQNQDREAYTSRFDYQINSNQTLSGTYNYRHENLLRPDADLAPGGAATAGFTTKPFGFQFTHTHFMAIAHHWNASSFTNEIRGGFQLSDPTFDRTDKPDFFVALPLVSNPESAFERQGRKTQIINFQDNAVKAFGAHSIRFGGQLQAFRINPFGPGAAATSTIPTYTVASGTATPALAAGAFPGGISAAQRANANALLALLGGFISAGNLTFNATSQDSGYVAGAAPNRNLDFENISGYFSDQWRVSRGLTLNLGLRYELFTPVREPNGLALEPVIPIDATVQAAILNPAGTYNFVGTNLGGNKFFKTDKDNFAPVISAAWSPAFKNKMLSKLFPGDNKTVIRGGFRISYVNDEFVRSADNALGGNAGLSQQVAALNPATGTGALNARFTSLPSFVSPVFQVPRTYAQNNALAGNFGTVFAVDPNLQVPRSMEYSFGIERQIGWHTAVEIRYVGARSDSLVRGLDLNQVEINSNGFLADFNRARANLLLTGNPGCTTAGCQPLTVFPLLQSGGLLSNATIQALIQAGQPGQLAFTYLANGFGGSSALFLKNPNTGVVDLLLNSSRFRYNSLQFELRRQFSKGLYFQANYTFQKNLTDAPGVGQTRFDPLLDNNQPNLDFTRADFDQTHVFNFNGIWDLPFGKGQHFLNEGGLVDKIVGGWELTSILRISTGAPLAITDPVGTLNRTGRSARQTAVTSLSTDQIKNLVGVFRTKCGVFYINPSAININLDTCQGSGRGSEGFGQPAFNGQVFFNNAPGQSSSLDRMFINGPNFVNWDASLIKNFKIGESKKLQFRVEAFNILNRANFCVNCESGATTQFTVFNINSPNFGRIQETFPQRILQFVGRFDF